MHSVALGDVPAAALVADVAGVVTAANARCAELFGRDVAGTPLETVLPGAPGAERVVAERANGVPFTAELAASDLGGGASLVLIHPLTGRRLLDEASRMLGAAFDGVPLGMAMYNTDGEFIRVNPAMCGLLDRAPEELIGVRDQELTHPDDRAPDLAAAEKILDGRLHTHRTEKRFLRPDGTVAWALANLVFLRDDDGRPLCWVGTFQDITERKRTEHRLRHLADHDPLTGLANRRRLVESLELHLAHAARSDERGAVLMLDLDGFKAVNDTQGHEAGDEVLAAVAVSLRRRLRVTDVIGRIGGDEFGIVLAHVDADGARTVADQLLAAVREASPTGVTASCGIALFGPGETPSADELLRSADRAMYAAKEAGRNAAHVAPA